MSLFNIVAPAADTVDVQSGGRGFLDDLGDALTAGAAGAVVSGLGSIYNTFASGANLLGADAELLNTKDTLDSIDTNWGSYYQKNQNAIDVAGFVGTSLIPGTLGIKALNLARAGSGAGAVGRALGFFETRQAASLSRALGELAQEGGSVFTQINKNKLAAMAWGAADQTLQAAAFETAVALTMKQSPLLADDSWWDIGKNAMVGAALGGLIGGGIDALVLNKSFKNAVGAIDQKSRSYDYVMNLDNFKLDQGDKAFAALDSLLKLPTEVLPEDKVLDLAFHVGRPDKVTGWNPLSKKISVDISTVLGNTLKGTEKVALQDFEKGVRALAADSDVATPFATKLLQDFTGLRSADVDAATIRERMGDWLHELKGVRAATSEPKVDGANLWYFKKSLNVDELNNIKTLEDWENAVKSSSPFDKNAYKDPYVFVGTTEQRQQAFTNAARIGAQGDNGYDTLSAAWKAGHDVAILPDGTFRVNDASSLWRRVKDPVFDSKRFVNVRTGSFTEDVVLTATDRAKAGTLPTITRDGFEYTTAEGTTKYINMTTGSSDRDVIFPALKTKDGEVIVGPKGGTHLALAVKQDRRALGSMESGFVRNGQWLTREEAENFANLGFGPLDAATLARKGKQPYQSTFNEAGDVEYFTARHAWASKLTDDQLPATIQVNDFSLMDRLRSVQGDALDNIKIVSPNGDSLGSASQLSIPDTIKSAKLSESQRRLSEAYEAGKTLDVRELAYILNVDGPWLENAVASRFRQNLAGTFSDAGKVVDNTSGISLPLDIYTRRENLIADYARPQQFQELNALSPDMSWQQRRNLIQESVANSGGQFVTGELAWGYRVQQAIRANKNASAAVLGAERAGQMIDLTQDAAKLANSLGSGASTFGASNADYGDLLKLFSQNQGKLTHKWIQEEVASAMDQIAPMAIKLRQNRQAAAEVGIVTNMLRSTDEKYVFSKVAGQERTLILKELAGLSDDKLNEAIEIARSEGRRTHIDIQNEDAANFLRTHSQMNSERVQRRTVLNNAKGITSNIDGEVVYVPPIDTTYFQHFAFVRPVEGKAFGTSEVTMVFGRDAAELQKRIGLIDRQNFDVVTKAETEKWFKAKDLYDFNLTINQPRINSELRRTGALSNIYPEVRAENVAEDYIRWHQNQAGRLVRDAVETNYAQQFAEIRKLGEAYTSIATSKFAGTTRRSATEITNPYDDYIKTALDVSKRSEYTFLHQANEFVDALGVRAYQALSSAFSDGKKGLIPWEEVNAIAEKHGIKGMYQNDAEYFLSNVPRDRNLIKEAVTKANMLLANTVLRLDFFNSIVNTVSTPLLLGTELASIRTALKNEPELLGKLGEALSISVPGGKGMAVPSATKLQAQAIANFFGDKGKELIARYRANGDIRDTLDQFHSMMDSLALRADFKAFGDGVTKAFEKAARFTLNEQAEQFTRFVSADVMRQLTEPAVEAGKLSLKEQNAFISVFTNRVQGNYVSSQRPIVFQGVLGSAVSLFQTYSFNLMQQLLRHVGNQDKRAVATMFGMQAGLFGLNGLPFFEAVNTHIIGNSSLNQGHHDAYSLAPTLLGKELGDWLMYGTASAMPLVMGDKMPALYTRGDINPRHMSILPLNPMDVPAVDASRRVVANLVDMGSKIAGGANVTQALLQGLEHNGINRPLAGFAQVLNGQSTTSKGSIISASSDFDLVTSAARILGSRPMDEALALNNLYRMKAYQAADNDRMEQLGERVKTYLYRNQFPPDDVMDTFMKDYAKAGGRLENFQGSMQKWAKDANVSTVENMRAKMKTSYGQRLSEIMGGEPLQDYRNVTPQIDVGTGEGAQP